MPKPNRIPKPKLPNGKIPQPAPLRNPDHVAFSFKYFDGTRDKFGFGHCGNSYAESLIKRLRDLSRLTWREMCTSNNKTMRVHPIDFADTSEPDGFVQLAPHLRELQPWQFSISSNEHGRVHGFVIDHVFFVVWIDAGHNLYPQN